MRDEDRTKAQLLEELRSLRRQTEALRESERKHRLESRERVIAAEERLRRQIAELLHGPVQTRLLVAWFRLGDCRKLLESDPVAAMNVLVEVMGEIEQVREQDVRRASHLLYPPAIGIGLAPAVRTLAGSFEGQLRICVDVDPVLAEMDGPLKNRLPEALRLAAYRVVEEGLNNVIRHARASRVQISLDADGKGRLTVAIEDDGVGFDSSSLQPGLGLGSIAGRVEQLGGTWVISSVPTRGTRLSASLPIPKGEG